MHILLTVELGTAAQRREEGQGHVGWSHTDHRWSPCYSVILGRLMGFFCPVSAGFGGYREGDKTDARGVQPLVSFVGDLLG